MIHAFALEPELVATWARRQEFRFIHDQFGFGAPRVLLELPAFSKWKDAVYAAASELDLEEKDWKRLEEIFRMFGEHRCRRSDGLYADLRGWMENAETEHDRKEFRAILATENPRGHRAVVLGEDLGAPKAKLWNCARGATPSRMPADVAAALGAMLVNCSEIYLIDPYFGPGNVRHPRMLEALLGFMSARGYTPKLVRVICATKNAIEVFEEETKQMASRVPSDVSIEFLRLQERLGGERLHNRYVMTDLGGVSLGIGLDAGGHGETDDLHLLTREQYDLRWSQYVDGAAAFTVADRPQSIVGSKVERTGRGSRRRR